MEFNPKALDQLLTHLGFVGQTVTAAAPLITAVEISLGYSLPPDYRHFVTHYPEHEIDVRENYVVLWGLGQLRSYNEDISTFTEYP